MMYECALSHTGNTITAWAAAKFMHVGGRSNLYRTNRISLVLYVWENVDDVITMRPIP